MNRIITILGLLCAQATVASAARPYIEFSASDEQPTARSVEEIIASLPDLPYSADTDWPVGPRIFYGFEPLPFSGLDSVKYNYSLATIPSQPAIEMPKWLINGMMRRQAGMRAAFETMGEGAGKIDFLAWELPEPPKLMAINASPEIPTAKAIPELGQIEAPIITEVTKKRHWLHLLTGAVQFSQAYISPNWYQGGDNNVTLLIDLLWNVKLNPVYHPQWMFESNMHYKLGLYSTPSDEVHNYSISEDLFQWNLSTGLKAARHWYYSFTLQFKTQFLNNYEANSWTRKASVLSPGELNVGLGMTYTKNNKKKGISFKAALAPLSYNLKTCVDHKIDPTLFGIKAAHKSISNIGSSADLVLNWQLTSNISWTSRIFMFSDYNDFTGDLENTFNFAINRFLSTQIYVHGRYDTSAAGASKGWKKWMLKEILSFGFSYMFSTVPKN